MLNIELPMYLQRQDGCTMKLTEFEPNPFIPHWFNYSMVVMDGTYEVGNIESSVPIETVEGWIRVNNVLKGNYERITERPLIVEVDLDAMQLVLSFEVKGGERRSFPIGWYVTNLRAVNRYANELYAMNVFGPSGYRSGAIPTYIDSITLREYIETGGEDRLDKYYSERAASTAKEYVRRLVDYIETGKKDFN